MKKLLSLLLISISFIACSNKDEDCCGIFPGDDIFTFSVVNEDGDDLLSPLMEGTLNTSKIKVYRIENGKRVLIHNLYSDYPNGYDMTERNGQFRMVPLIGPGGKLQSTGIIQWNKNEEDTITLHYIQAYENIKLLVKILYNGKEVWNNEDISDERYFEIVKPN